MFNQFIIIILILFCFNIPFYTQNLNTLESFENGMNGWISIDYSNQSHGIAKWGIVPEKVCDPFFNWTVWVFQPYFNTVCSYEQNKIMYCVGSRYANVSNEYDGQIHEPQYENNMGTRLIMPGIFRLGELNATKLDLKFKYAIPSIDGGSFLTGNDDYFEIKIIYTDASEKSIFKTDDLTTDVTSNDWKDEVIDLIPYLDPQKGFNVTFNFISNGSNVKEGIYLDDIIINYVKKAFINIISPTNYDQWGKGSSYKVKWESNFTGNVSVYLYKNNGSTPVLTEPSIPNLKEHDLFIPNSLEVGSYYIRVQSDEFLNAHDNSSVFSIVEPSSNLNISAPSLDFGKVEKGRKLVRSVILTNNGNASTTVNINRTGSTSYTANMDNLTLEKNQSKEVLLTFAPSSTGTKNASFSFIGNKNSIAVNCVGEGVISQSNQIYIQQANNTDFAEVLIGTKRNNQFRVKNNGTNNINVNMSIEGTDEFYLRYDSDSDFILASGGNKIIEVRLSPNTRGEKFANLVATITSTGEQFKFPLTGTGIEAAQAVSISPTAGIYYTKQTVSMNANTGLEIRFTIDGSEPDKLSNLYSGPFDIQTTTTIKAKSFWSNNPPYTQSSDVVTNIITITGTVELLRVNLEASTYYGDIRIKFMEPEENTKIYYTIDGSDPSITTKLYKDTEGILLEQTANVKARAYRNDWIPSPIFSGQYEIIKILEKPFFLPSTDSLYKDSIVVYIINSEPNAEIRYTKDGTIPDNSSILFQNKIILYTTTTLKAKVFKQGWAASEIATATYNFQMPQKAQFTEQPSISLIGVNAGTGTWGDYNNDGYLDILLTGLADGGKRISKIYKNNGNGTFSEQTSIFLIGVNLSSAAWGDYDNDGDLDILLTGLAEGDTLVSKIYKNKGDGTFNEQTSVALIGVARSSVAWGDYNNDGHLDILLTGLTDINDNGSGISKIYKNNGDETFTEQLSINLADVSRSSIDWGDYNNDGNIDILLTGLMGGKTISRIYKNNGDGTIDEQISIHLTGVDLSSVTWGDYDNDGNLDILLTGENAINTGLAKIYRNNGNGTFTDQTSISLIGVYNSSVAWGDYDNDGRIDILLTGKTGNDRVSKVYRNNGDTTFAETVISITGVESSSVAWGDYDNDGDLDILLTGWTGNTRISKVYTNNNSKLNTVPTVPTNLTSSVNGDSIIFSWTKSTDIETPQDGLQYNLAIGTTPYDINIFSPMSNINTGYRQIVDFGNTNHNNTWVITGLHPGRYYWSVQAIDNCFAGSKFSPPQNVLTSITDDIFTGLPTEFKLYDNFPNPFNPSTIIKYQIPIPKQVSLKIYDILGTEIITLINEVKDAGIYEVIFNAKNLPSGIYFYRIQAGSFTDTKKFILLK